MDRPLAAADRYTRRALLRKAAQLGVAASTLGALDALAWTPTRVRAAAQQSLPDIQFAIAGFTPAAVTVEGVPFKFGPLYTLFATLQLTRTPTKADQARLASALAQVEASYPFRPEGVFTFISYGIPYFQRLPGGMAGALASEHIPRLLEDPTRFALEEAVPGPTDVSSANPGVGKATFNVPVQIESNDMLLTLRSDSTANIDDVLGWLLGRRATLNGSKAGTSGLRGLLKITSRRLMFQQRGLPRQLAPRTASRTRPTSTQNRRCGWASPTSRSSASGPPEITTFLGNSSAKLTTAMGGDYFDNGSILHLSHVIQDLAQFYAQTRGALHRARAVHVPLRPYPVDRQQRPVRRRRRPLVPAERLPGGRRRRRRTQPASAPTDGRQRIGHVSALQRSSRAADGTPMHIRADGPGFDAMDVPGGWRQPKLQFSIFVPSAEFFRTMRRNQAAQDLVQQFKVPDDDNGLERFITATRRQNFLVPPRRNRAFPLLELT